MSRCISLITAIAAVIMTLIKFQIVLDQPVYYSGQNVTGKLIIEVDKPKTIRAIFLKYIGAAHVRWSESTTTNNKTTTTVYSSTEEYFSLQQLVFGNESEDCELSAGEHIFHFNFQLPINLPSSFEGMYGRIRYFLKAVISRNWKFDHTKLHMMTVMSVFDLNNHPLATVPVAEHKSKTFWGHSQPLLMTLNIPVRGFVPGQIIPIVVSLNNQSGVQVKAIGVSLKQLVRYHAPGKSNYSRLYIFKNEFPVPGKGLGSEDVPLNLQLPSAPSSYLEFCRIMDLEYQLSVTAKVASWYHKNLRTRTELIIGNIPIIQYQRPIPAHRMIPGTVDPEEPPAYGFAVPGTTYDDLPPPSYEMSMRIGTSEQVSLDDADEETTKYSPLYPVYKFET